MKRPRKSRRAPALPARPASIGLPVVPKAAGTVPLPGITVPEAQGFLGRFAVGAGGALLAAAIAVAYHGTLHVPFLLDDQLSITGNSSIRRLWPLGPVLSPPVEAGVGGRPLINVSFALNYAVGGLSVVGYHLTNLLIHLAASLVLFGVVRRTLGSPTLSARFGAAATPLALAVSGLWALHPLQTEAVTYLSQRAESLMGLLFLSTLYLSIRGFAAVAPGTRLAWYAASTLAAGAALAAKEVAASAPLIVLLYDRTFVSGGFRAAWRRHWPLFCAFAVTLLLLAPRIASLGRGTVVYGVGFGGALTWWEYALMESRVIVRYLALAFWPHPLVFDYGPLLPGRIGEVWPYLAMLAALAIATVVALVRHPALGFAAAWFLVILAPTSTVIPVVGQPMAESRMYLPLAGVASLAVLGVCGFSGRRGLALCAVAGLVFAAVTVERNALYNREVTLWQDTVVAAPRNPRAHYNLGTVYSALPGRSFDAIAEYRAAVQLVNYYPEAHNNLGSELERIPGRREEAVRQLEEAVREDPGFADAHYNLGIALKARPADRERAVEQFREAVRLRPDFAAAHTNLGNLLIQLPKGSAEAVSEFRAALRIEPGLAEAHNSLGNALSGAPGRQDEAEAEFRAALRLRPDYAAAHNNLGNVLRSRPGQAKEAIDEYEAALRLDPNLVQAHQSLWLLLSGIPGRGEEAKEHARAVLRIMTNSRAHSE